MNVVLRLVKSFSGPPEPSSRYDGPGPTSPASSYLITAGDTRLLVDLGNGSFGVLQRHLDPWLLDAVVLSHLHADHCADMTNLVVHRRYHPDAPADVAPLPVFGPADTPARLAYAYAASPEERASTDLSDVLAFRKAADGGTVGDLALQHDSRVGNRQTRRVQLDQLEHDRRGDVIGKVAGDTESRVVSR